MKELAEKVWRLDNLRQTAEECGIDYESLPLRTMLSRKWHAADGGETGVTAESFSCNKINLVVWLNRTCKLIHIWSDNKERR